MDCQNDGLLPDFEELCDDNTDNVYSIIVITTGDDTSDQKAGECDATVTDVEEEGRVAADLPNDPPLVNDILTYTLSGPYGGILFTDGDIDWTI